MIKTTQILKLLAPFALLLPAQAQNCEQDSCGNQERAQRTSIQDPADRPSDRSAIRKRLLKKYDANKDGKLDRKELAQARKDGALPGRGEGGEDPTPQEQRGRRARLLKKYDANKNGKLDKNELAQAKKDGALPERGEEGEGRKKPRDGEGRKKPTDGEGETPKKRKGKRGKIG